MAQLDVQPKKNRTWWIWVLITIFALAVIFYFVRRSGRDASDPNLTGGDSAVIRNAFSNDVVNWNDIPFNSPQLNFEEVNDEDIAVRGNEQFAIYGIDESVLFDSGADKIRVDAEQKLLQIIGSIKKRFKGGSIRVYGYTDSEGSRGYNKELAQQRAEAVKNWIAENGVVQEDRISVNPVGESNPVASNATAGGRQQNRRVEIVATL